MDGASAIVQLPITCCDNGGIIGLERRHLLLGMAALPIVGRAAATGMSGTLEQLISTWAATNQFSGVVALGRTGKVTYSQAIGLASIEDHVAATPSTQYAIGSVSKWFTTTAVLRLCDRGMLALDAPIATYLPSITGDAGSKVRLAHLLSNTSGIPDRIAAAIKADPAIRVSTASAAEMSMRFAPGNLTFEPGSQFDYTVLNWVIVRAILERVTGMAFTGLIRELVLKPAGVDGVGIAENGFANLRGLAPAYRSINPPVRKADPVGAFAAASGTFYANASELITTAHRVFGARLLTPLARKAMLTVRVPTEDYALGGRVHVIGGRVWAWETGKIGGYRTHLAHNVEQDCSIAILGNTDLAQSTISAFVDQLTPLA